MLPKLLSLAVLAMVCIIRFSNATASEYPSNYGYPSSESQSSSSESQGSSNYGYPSSESQSSSSESQSSSQERYGEPYPAPRPYHDSCSDESANRCNRNYLRDIARSLPKEITIISPADAGPFFSRYDNNEPTGFDVELIKRIGELLEITFTYTYGLFLQFIPTVQANPNEISVGFQTDTIAREASANFVDFCHYYNGFIVRSNYTETITGLSDLCGKTVVVLVNSIQANDVQGQNTICGSSNPINILIVASITDILDNVKSEKADVGVFLQPVLEYAADHSNGQLITVGQPYNLTTAGFVCNKGNEDLCCALVDALNYLIRDGEYQRILKDYVKYNVIGLCPSRLNLNGTTCSSVCAPDC